MQRVDWQDGDGDAHTLERDALGRRAHVLVTGGGARWWLDHGDMQPHPADGPSGLTLEEAKAQAERALGLPVNDSVPGICGVAEPPDDVQERATVETPKNGPQRDAAGWPGLGRRAPITLVRRLASTAPAQVQAELDERADRVDGYYDALRQLAEAETVPSELLEQMQREAAAFARDVGDAALEVRLELLLQQQVEKAILDHYQAQADAARRRFKVLEASVERIEEQVLRIVCERAGAGDTHTLKLTTAKVAIWKNAPAVALDDDLDARLLPERFQRITVEADRKALCEALKAGENVPGCSLVQRDRVEVR